MFNFNYLLKCDTDLIIISFTNIIKISFHPHFYFMKIYFLHF